MSSQPLSSVWQNRLLRRATSVALTIMLIGQFLFSWQPAPTANAFSNSWPFTTASEYTYDSAKIQVTSGEAQLGRSPDWWDTSYAYRQRITVTAGTTAITTTDTIAINLDAAALVTASKMQADHDDLRIVYWNGSTNTNIDRDFLSQGLGNPTTNSDVRFKAQAAISAAASDTGYYLYYGNSGASAGPTNLTNVYRYYEPFSTDVLGSGAWSNNGSGWAVSGGRLTKTSSEGVDRFAANLGGTGLSTTSNWYFESTFRRTSATNSVSGVAMLSSVSSPSGWWAPTFYVGVPNDIEIWRSSGKLADGTGTVSVLQNTDYRETMRFIRNNDCISNWATLRVWLDGTQYNNATETNVGNCPATIYAGVHLWTAMAEWDDYKVWQYLNETTSFAAEETTYPTDDPTVTPTLTTSFVTLSAFTETSTLNGGAIRYILSNDGGSNWLYHNGATWVASDTTYSQATTAANINSNVGTFPTGSGNFVFRAFLHSNGTQLVKLDNVTINGNRTPNTPTLTSPANGGTATSATPTFQLVATDDDSDGLQYELQIDTSNAFNTSDLLTYKQTTSQTGWSGQDALAGAGYASGTTANFTVPTNLTAASTYYWRARVTDPAGTNTTSAYSATSSFHSITAISNVTATPESSHVVIIRWTTNHAATSQVQYGLTTSYGQTASDATLTTEHRIDLSGLTSNTLYHFRVSSSGNSSSSDIDRTVSTYISTPTILNPVVDQKFATIQTVPVIGLAGSGQTVTVYLDGTLVATTTARTTTTGTGDFIVRLHNLTLGTHRLAVGASTSSNTAIVDNDVTFRIVPPSIAPTFFPPIVTDGLRPKMTIRGLAPAGSKIVLRRNNRAFRTVYARNTTTGVGDFQATFDTQTLANATYTITGIGYDANGVQSRTKTATVFEIGDNRLVRPKSSAGFVHYVAMAESLWSLARQFYGSSRLYTKLVDANDDRFPSLATNPARLQLGWRLIVPR